MGMNVGESKTVELLVPDTWWEKDRRGTTLLADITVKELFSWDVPEVNLLPSPQHQSQALETSMRCSTCHCTRSGLRADKL